MLAHDFHLHEKGSFLGKTIKKRAWPMSFRGCEYCFRHARIFWGDLTANQQKNGCQDRHAEGNQDAAEDVEPEFEVSKIDRGRENARRAR